MLPQEELPKEVCARALAKSGENHRFSNIVIALCQACLSSARVGIARTPLGACCRKIPWQKHVAK
eukprot:2174461-Pyramimonas_sp.AAC.1